MRRLIGAVGHEVMTAEYYPIITQDGSQTLYSEAFAQTFHSRQGAISESQHVFVAGSGVAARLSRGQATRVLEVGFGTGLNFLLTADLALAHDAPLYYRGLERALLPVSIASALGYRTALKHPELYDALMSYWAAPAGAFEYRSVTLVLLLGEATEQALGEAEADAIYQDAFSPTVNPELWSEAFLGKLSAALAPGGCLSTYSVSGVVRRRLAALGLAVAKRPGPPGGKREMLVACKSLGGFPGP